jgi:16S rRNA C967 or C1407 C5-methylase (RsmB/RsmF family)/NOL1/NOP2/fmu family ribosome biogenesis protein
MAFPELFKKQTPLKPHELRTLLEALDNICPTSIRINSAKIDVPAEHPISWSDHGQYLKKRPHFFADPLWHAGAYYVQEASSMFISHILNQLSFEKEELRFFDSCAAPGGKSLILSDFLRNKGVLISNEPISKRNKILQENVAKWGSGNTLICQNFTHNLKLEGYFDLILIDAPCSGEGMFRKDLNARSEWSEDNVQLCVKRQRDILDDLLPSVKKEGYVIYSTCTFNRHENEEQIEYIKSKGFELIDIPLKQGWGVESSNNGLRFYPHKVEGEGFFCAVLQKKVESSSLKIKSKKKVKKDKIDLPDFFQNNFPSIQQKDQKLWACPMVDEELSALEKVGFNFSKKGIELGNQKGKNFIPSAELAFLSLELPYPKYELSYDEAILFLSQNQLTIQSEKKGVHQLYYAGVRIGFAKHLGKRTNNLYRKDWRLRKLPSGEEKFSLVLD